MAMTEQTVDYYDGATPLQAFMAYDTACPTPLPAVLIAHAWGGRDAFVEHKARQLAALGYVGFALDMYGRSVRGQSREENAALMRPFMEDRALLRQRILAALCAVRAQDVVDSGRIAAIGFCFGGLCVLDLARSGADVCGVVSFHGLLMPPAGLSTQPIGAKVLVLHGHDDPMVPVEHVVALQSELTAAGADWQIHSYGQTMHAFTNPEANDPAFGTVYQAIADRRSWQAMQNFLAEIFA